MAETRIDAGTLLFGGLFIGTWLALMGAGVFHPDDVGPWFVWGLVGLGLAGALYGARVTQGIARAAIFVAIGILAAYIIVFLTIQEQPLGLAALLTFLGGGLISVGIPSPRQPGPEPQPPQWQPAPEPYADPTPYNGHDEAHGAAAYEEEVVRTPRGVRAPRRKAP